MCVENNFHLFIYNLFLLTRLERRFTMFWGVVGAHFFMPLDKINLLFLWAII